MTTVSNMVSRILIVTVGVIALLLTTPVTADTIASSSSKPEVDVYLTLHHNNDRESARLESTVAGKSADDA